jgi:4-nitrophenyl phosphatase
MMRTSILPGVRALILDMDGVLWRDNQPIGDLSYIFQEFNRRGFRIALATNNATRSVKQYLEKLSRFGVVLENWQVINSSLAVASYLQKRFAAGGFVYVVGEDGLIQTLQEYGFMMSDQNVLAVVAGMDRTLTYGKLRTATLLIRSGAAFIGTNPDRTFPTPHGLVPGAGSILAALEAATDVQPIVVGKPFPEMYRFALDRLGCTPQETLVVGDRLETDIAGAQALGCRTALVLSGVTSQEEALKWSPQPDLVVADLANLLNFL